MKRAEALRLRKEREATVAAVLQALTADGTPAPLDVIAARAGLTKAVACAAVHDLEEHPGSGPLFVSGGYVWIHMGPEQQAAD